MSRPLRLLLSGAWCGLKQKNASLLATLFTYIVKFFSFSRYCNLQRQSLSPLAKRIFLRAVVVDREFFSVLSGCQNSLISHTPVFIHQLSQGYFLKRLNMAHFFEISLVLKSGSDFRRHVEFGFARQCFG